MPRTIPAALETAIIEDVTRICRLVRITRADGFILRLTDSIFDIHIGAEPDVEVYRSKIGFTTSAMMVGLNLAQQQGVSMTVALTDDGITRSDIKNRRYYGASVEIFECDFTAPDDSLLLMFMGTVGRVSYTQTGSCDVEVLNGQEDATLADEVYSQTCRADLGDSRCSFPIDMLKLTATVVAVSSNIEFTLDTFGPTAEGQSDVDFFALGQLKWLTGDNEGWEMDILRGTLDTKIIELFYPTPSDIVVGDTLLMYPGCDKQFSTCRARFDNAVNFRGEPFAPQWTI